MRNLLFISNFKNLGPMFRKKLPQAAIFAVLGIITIEFIMAQILPNQLFSHTVDHLLFDLKREKYNSPLVLLGDSVGSQVLTEFHGGDNNRGALLSTMIAVEMPAQYFLVRRYLRRNKKPKAVIYMGSNPLGMNLAQEGTENFVQRCFLNWDEILELVPFKGVNFSSVMMFYKFFPTYRYRLHLQEKLVGFTNASIFSGERNVLDNRVPKKAGIDTSHSILAFLEPKNTPSLSEIYLGKMLKMLAQQDIKFIFVPAPIHAITLQSESTRTNIDEMFNTFYKMRSEYSNFIFTKEILPLGEKYFKKEDPAHLSPLGAKIAAKHFATKVVNK